MLVDNIASVRVSLLWGFLNLFVMKRLISSHRQTPCVADLTGQLFFSLFLSSSFQGNIAPWWHLGIYFSPFRIREVGRGRGEIFLNSGGFQVSLSFVFP